MNIFARPGYCQSDAIANLRVFSLTCCNNKARYRLVFENEKTIDICGTHLRQYVHKNTATNKIIKVYGGIVEIIDLKTNKTIYTKQKKEL